MAIKSIGLCCAFLLAACAGPTPEFPAQESAQTEFATGGVVFVDSDQDGRPTSSDNPVQSVTVAPLTGRRTPVASEITYFDEANTETVTTNTAGSFTLNYRVNPELAGLRLDLPAPVANTEAVGQLSLVLPLELGSMQNVIALTQLPRDCSGQQDNDCGPFLYPDLVPIISWDQIDPGAQARLANVRNGEDPAGLGPAALGPAALGPAADDADAPQSEGLLPPETWFIETEPTGRTLLRFSSVTANLGLGPLDIIAENGFDPTNGDPGSEAGTSQTWQRLWSDSWNYQDTPSGEFIFHPSHDHIHFDAFERYRLIDQNGEVIAESDKVSFCLRDSLRVSDDPTPTTGIFGPAGACGAVEQAINPGYADYYNEFLPDQWIDITDVSPGRYTVEITVDPLDVIIESDETNNSATFEIIIEGPS